MESYLIVDFGASLIHTHHKQSIFSYANLLKQNGKYFEILVPKGSQLESTYFKVNKNLLPGTHPCSFQLMKPQTYLASLIGKLHNFANKKNSKIIINVIAFLVVRYFLLIISKKKYADFSILFPTICPFSILAIQTITAGKMKNRKIFARLTNTSENRGLLSNTHNKQLLFKLANENKNIRLGFEISNNLPKQDNIFYVPFPTNKIIKKVKKSDDLLVISFLGYPSEAKGYRHIDRIINEVSKYRNDIRWIVHDYELSRNSTFESISAVKVLRGKISVTEMEHALSETDLICLPYDPIYFSNNVSAMLYQAMDYEIPAICLNGTAFSIDIQRFKNGFVSDSVSDLISTLIEISPMDLTLGSRNCITYNSFRNFQNNLFLDLN